VEQPKILDLTAGQRLMWYDRANPMAVFVDIRRETAPQVIANSCRLPFSSSAAFTIVLFDPPHQRIGAAMDMARRYGSFSMDDVMSLVSGAALEAWRVSANSALMVLKWNDKKRSLRVVLSRLYPWWEPLFGQVTKAMHSSATHWMLLHRRSTPIIQAVLQNSDNGS
jgi:hypothetical protein